MAPLRLVGTKLVLPLALHSVCAGFPSPADDYLDENIDLTRLLIVNPPATFLWRVEGKSMIDAGIFPGDLVVVDRSLEPRQGDAVIAIVNGERSIKRINLRGGGELLQCANRRMPPFVLPECAEVEIWGVVTWCLRGLRRAGPR
jgi:DNA polymerase V